MEISIKFTEILSITGYLSSYWYSIFLVMFNIFIACIPDLFQSLYLFDKRERGGGGESTRKLESNVSSFSFDNSI